MKPLMGPPPQAKRQRLNVVACVVSLFVPWAVFCVVATMLSSSLRFSSPVLVQVIIVMVAVPLVLYTAYRVYITFKTLWHGVHLAETGSNTLWTLFVCVTCAVALVLAVMLGSYNYKMNMQAIFDVGALSAYVSVNPMTMRGQELMDAGRVQFVDGANLDLKLSNGFKNTDVYCVAPITVSDAVLASYDFWAVGKNCCSDQKADFKCGAYNAVGAKGGVRLTNDVDRDFYRLAVQQAASSHAIKAIHPLFFEWTSDAAESLEAMEREGYKCLLTGILGHFLFQAVLVAMALTCFSKIRFD